MSYSGKFKPKNYKKYKGDPTKIFYRSLWERRFMVYCDNNPNIIEWGSEELIIPYISPLDKKPHRYFPDFYIKYVNGNGQTVREVIEVKPKKQTNTRHRQTHKHAHTRAHIEKHTRRKPKSTKKEPFFTFLWSILPFYQIAYLLQH